MLKAWRAERSLLWRLSQSLFQSMLQVRTPNFSWRWCSTCLLGLLRIEDGIVLSPQRQSFFQGCQIPHSAPERHLLQERGRSGLSRTTDREREGRSRLTGRLGRGRTLDYKERNKVQCTNIWCCYSFCPWDARYCRLPLFLNQPCQHFCPSNPGI